MAKKPAVARGRPSPEPIKARLAAFVQAGRYADAEPLFDQLWKAEIRDLETARHGLRLKLSLKKFRDSEVIARLLTGARSTDSAAWNDLGVALAGQGRAEEALAAFTRAAETAPPGIAGPHMNLGNARRRARDFEGALAAYHAAATTAPEDPEPHFRMGQVFRDLRRNKEALVAFGAAVDRKLDHVNARGGLALALMDLGRFKEALPHVTFVAAEKPGMAEAHFQLGRCIHESGDSDAAAVHYRKALEIEPDHAGALNNLGVALAKRGREDEAAARDRRGGRQQTADADAAREANEDLLEENRLDEAIAVYRRSVALKPDYPGAWSNLASALFVRGDREESIACYRRQLELEPTSADAHANLGSVLQWVGRLDEAGHLFEKALEIRPDFPSGEFNLATLRLLQGRWEEGWRHYESRIRWKPEKYGRTNPPIWDGTSPHRTIVVMSEQGLGDSLQFIRFAPLFAATGRPIKMAADKRLNHFFTRAYPELEFLPDGVRIPDDVSHWLPLMSLPGLLGTRPGTIPAVPRYLSADPARTALWRERLGGHGFRIVFVWQGNPKRHVDLGRSYALDDLAPIAALPGVRLIAVQKNTGLGQLENCPFRDRVELPGHDFDEGPDAFVDTAAIMEAADLVVTPDTSIVHLAGALGVPTLCALKKVPDWRWLTRGETTPFYPSVRLYRQTVVDRWDDVMARMAADIAARAAAKG